MDHKTRLIKTFNLEQPDRPPILGGWLAAPNHIQALTGCAEEVYWADTQHWGLEAERVLGSDGLIGIFKPASRGEYRIIDHDIHAGHVNYTLESFLAEIKAMPDPGDLEKQFDEETEYARFLADFQAQQAQCGEMLWCPADWDIKPRVLWFSKYGHEIILMAIALHPEPYRKFLRVLAVQARQRSILRARAMRAGIYPRAILTGDDLCDQRGPMVSPKFLRRDYFPLVEYAFEPLLQAGAKLIWHCDGNYRALMNDILALGVGGLQGFQRECEMDLEWIVNLRTRAGDPLIIYGPMSVTTTLPNGTPDDVRVEVRRAMEICRDQASLVFFTSNTIIPDTPLANIRAFWQAVQASRW